MYNKFIKHKVGIMKYINLTLIIIVLLFAVGCNKTNEITLPELFILNYDSLLVESVINITPDLVVANLKEWDLDEEATELGEDMLYFNNINNYGMITAKAYSDGKVLDYIEEIKMTFENINLLSEKEFVFNDNNYFQYFLQNEGFIIVKAVIELSDNNYIDTNILVVENKYPEVTCMIETYLASISILNNSNN